MTAVLVALVLLLLGLGGGTLLHHHHIWSLYAEAAADWHRAHREHKARYEDFRDLSRDGMAPETCSIIDLMMMHEAELTLSCIERAQHLESFVPYSLRSRYLRRSDGAC